MKLEDFPHLVEMKTKLEKMKFGTVEYWKARCNFLEKRIDPTYTVFEQNNCREFYKILVNKEK